VQKTLESDQPVVFDWSGSPELRQLANDLTRLSRTHASQTRNLRAHARELEATNRYKTEFLANVSHELRTPLNSILLLSKLLASRDSELDEESREQADVIHKAGCDLKALIDNILDLSRIESGRLELHLESVPLAELLEDLRLLLKPQFDAKGLQLELQFAPGSPRLIETDVDKVRQVLKNFLANAVKFADHGEVTLAAAPAAAPYAVALSVRDQGIGIPPAKQEAIFEAFQQADGSTSRRYGGTGLGLTISRQLAELLGGEIRLVSQVGRGAEFSLLLPAVCSQEGIEARASSTTSLPAPDEEPEVAPNSLQGLHVLLMEPDVRSQLRLSGMLRAWGMSLHLADDLEEATESLDEFERVDFLLIDALMPDDGACVTIRRMREHLGDSTVVIGMIPADRVDAAETCLGQGADDFVTLPCDAHQLSEVLSRHLHTDAE
jgi:signal transduction histidine kinase/CheY-like chemotaxis protein